MATSPWLEKNLGALAKVDRALFERICLPVDDQHLVEQGGKRFLRVHSTLVGLALSDQECAAVKADGAELFLLGIGEGELVEYLLQAHPSLKLTAWERDPWMMRLALGRADWSKAISSGRLTLRMGVDLLGELPRTGWVDHPRLGPVYGPERMLLAHGWGERRALVCTGGLFVEDLSESLRDEGYSVYPLEIQKLSPEELAHTVQVARPQLVACINYTQGLAEFLQAHPVELLVWEVDPATDRLAPVPGSTQRAHVFTYRRAHEQEFRQAGFGNVAYLPLATNPRRRAPVSLSTEEQHKYGALVSFVGSSMVPQAAAHRARFAQLYAAWRGRPEAAREAEALLEAALQRQRADFSRFSLGEALTQSMGEFLAAHRQAGSVDPLLLAAEVAASEKRLAYAGALGRFGLALWGDGGWQGLSPQGCHYRGLAGHYVELNKIYSGSLINLDVGRLYQSDIITMRIFDVLACGGFVLAERSPELEAVFREGEHLDAYSTREELQAKVEYYRAHPERARALAQRGRDEVLAHHTIGLRTRYMLGRLGLGAGG